MDNREIFEPVISTLAHWAIKSKCEGECIDCEQQDLCYKILDLLHEMEREFDCPENRRAENVQSEEKTN